jgi:hypothetical protein
MQGPRGQLEGQRAGQLAASGQWGSAALGFVLALTKCSTLYRGVGSATPLSAAPAPGWVCNTQHTAAWQLAASS